MDDDDSEKHEVDYTEHEPQVDSDDPNERKLARKLRIERRWEAVRRQGLSDGSLEEEEKKEIQIQVQKSADILEKFINESEEYVTNVRVACDAREVDRRDTEGIGREKVMEQLENEAEAAENMFHEITEKWIDIQSYNDPLHINEEILNQQEKCDLVIRQKDEVIAMLKDEVKKAERNFTKDQAKQMEDINTLAIRIERQITFMRQAYHKEFGIIEDVILGERSILIDMNNKKWDELYKKREQHEIANSDEKFEQLEDFYDTQTKTRVDFQEKFRETKIKLANDIDYLQDELERIKALALLNSEKLDYNYQILKKREDENIIIKSQQKRKINKLQDIINDLRHKIADYETVSNNRIKKLTDDIAKAQHCIIQVEEKADHFAKINDEKFHQVWEINREHCQTVLKKILETDKILHEQQMGITWVAPIYNIIDKSLLPSYKAAMSACTAEVKDKKSQSLLSTVSSAGKAKETQYDATATAKTQPKLENLKQNPIYKRLLKYILTHISDKSGFLTEKRLKALIKYFEDDQKTLVRVDNVFESLGIHEKQDIDILISFFVPYAYCSKCQGPDTLLMAQPSVLSRFTSQLSQLSSAFSRTDREDLDVAELEQAFFAVHQPVSIIDEVIVELVASEECLNDAKSVMNSSETTCGEPAMEQYSSDPREKKTATKKAVISDEKTLCQYNHPLVISSVYILRALREFVTSYYEEKEGLPTTGERLDRKRRTVSRILTEEDINTYWERFKLAYNEDRIRVWDALLEGLRKYHEILKDRKYLSQQVVHLRKQNEDLKRLLSNYINNGEYLTPPCAIEQEFISSTVPPYTGAKM